jgi:GTPase SAR1 family protein
MTQVVNSQQSKIEVDTMENLAKTAVATVGLGAPIVIKSQRQFTTSLMGKDEIFKLLSLAETLKLAILLVGPPGTGKTNIVTDYTKGMFDLSNPDHVEHLNNEGVFMLETDEGTKSSEIKGTVNLEKLVTQNKYEIASHIADADTIIINEVDKASSALRNSLLGIMNERILFNGKEKKRCKWKLFVATCNEIPKDEVGSPFWDRFLLKITVNRLQAGELMKYYKSGAKNYSSKIKINIPSTQQIDAVNIPNDKMEKFLNVAYKECSDRTLSSVPRMAQAISLVYNCSVDKALIKACELLVNKQTAEKLSKELLSTEKRAVMDKVDLISGMTNEAQIEKAMDDIEKMVGNFAAQGKFSQSDLNELKQLVEAAMSSHPYYKIEVETDGEEAVEEEEEG